MPRTSSIVALDIGGSHVTAAVIDSQLREIVPGTRARVDVDESSPSDVILDAWAGAALEAASGPMVGAAHRIGIAMPAPFDYARGVSLMQHKFQALYGVDVVASLHARFAHSPLEGASILVANDADLFALGEWWAGAAQGQERVIGLTLGTGFGSGFIARGRIVTIGPDVPAGGEIWNLPYLDGVAEDYVNGRAITAMYAATSGSTLSASDVADRARAGDRQAADAYNTLAEHLARILDPLVEQFHPTCIVVGGNVARAWSTFGPQLRIALPSVDCQPSALFEDAALLGAAALART